MRDEPGSVSWCELLTHDAKAGGRFYAGLFGWTLQDMPMPDAAYAVFSQGSTMVGGMMVIQKEWGPMPSNWLTYFAVSDCDATVAKAKQMGGAILKPPADVPKVGRFAILSHPQGASFAVIQSASV